MRSDLRGVVAVVTGASRGLGRAIAVELGVLGACVYLTGRSARGRRRTEGLPGTIEETADQITAGGHGIPVRCDHRRSADVEALLRRVEVEQGRLDVLVNNAWGGYERHDRAEFEAHFWEQSFARRWRGMFEAGLGATLLCSSRAAPLLLRGGGLIVNTVAWDGGAYLGNLFYDVAKAGVVRATADMARELGPLGVGVVALAPGFVRTERVMAVHGEQPLDLSRTESPTYAARAVVALVRDEWSRWSGEVVTAAELARQYGFSDEDGSQPGPFHL